MPDVSVVMATYMGERFLLQQLRSLAAQTLTPAELVVADDGSTDATVGIVEAFAATAPFPVRVQINPARLNYRANFVRAAGRATSPLVAFCDQDDIWAPEKLATIAKTFEAPDVLLAFHNADIVSQTEHRIGSLSRLAPPTSSSRPLTLGPWAFSLGFTQILRRELLVFDDLWQGSVAHDREGTPVAHDQWYFFIASMLGTIAYCDIPLAQYRQHGNNLSGVRFGKARAARLRGLGLNQADYYDRHATAAESRSAIAASIAARSGGEIRQRAEQGAQMYRTLSVSLSKRAELYRGRSVARRGTVFRDLVRSGDYRNERWRLGPKAMLKDCCLGVCLAPLLRAPRSGLANPAQHS